MLIAYAKGARTFERHIDIDYRRRQGHPLTAACRTRSTQWFKPSKRRKRCAARRELKSAFRPRKRLNILTRSSAASTRKNDLEAGHLLTDDDVYLAIPLQKGQLSCRELMSGEVLLKPIRKDAPINIDDIDSHYAKIPSLRQTIYDRGLDGEK